MATSEADSILDFFEDSKFGCEEKSCKLNYKYYIDGIALLVVAIFGTIGTIMSLVVLLKPRIITRRDTLLF